MRKQLFIFLIFTCISCKENINDKLRGDWKLIEFMRDNEVLEELPNFPLTYFKDDNLIIYFESLMNYEIEGDSILFSEISDKNNILLKMQIEILDENTFIFYYKRRVTNKLIDSTYIIPLYSKWEKIK